MRSFFLCILIALGSVQCAQADIIFTLLPTSPGILPLGEDVVFQLFVRSDSGPIVNNIAGIDAWIDASDPTFTGTQTAGGQFVAGTSDFFVGVGDPFQVPFPTSFVLFSANVGAGEALSLGTTNELLATITFSTAGATPGNYVINVSQLVVLDPSSNPIQVSNLSTTSINYTIVAVPEPCSVGFIGLSLAGVAWRDRSKKRA